MNEKTMNKEFNDTVKGFPYFRPTNQLPFPAVAGQVLLTKSDFNLPARPDLLEWANLENVIGVADIRVTYNEEDMTATIYKLFKNDGGDGFNWQPVGVIGNVDEENATKLKNIEYINYVLLANDATHELKLMGVKTVGGVYEEISTVNYISYTEYQNKINDIETRLTNDETAISQNATDITNLRNDLNDVETDLTQLISDFNLLNNDVVNNIKPVINILKTATNPNLVLSKGNDGVTLVWRNVMGVDDVVATVDNQTHTITFYKVLNGVQTPIITIDKFEYQTFINFANLLQQISNDLNERTQPDYVLMKNIDGTTYDWQSINNIVNVLMSTDPQDSNKRIITISAGSQTITFIIYTTNYIDTQLANKLDLSNIVILTWTEYEAITHDPNTYYIISDRI